MAQILTTFIGSYLESLPLLVVGVAMAAIIDQFASADEVARVLPKNSVANLAVCALLGIVLPVGQLGTLPVAKRLLDKGLSLSGAITYLICGPTINLVVLASSLNMLGFEKLLFLRVIVVITVGISIGLIFLPISRVPSLAFRGSEGTLRPSAEHALNAVEGTTRDRWQRAMKVAGEEVFHYASWLLLGSLLVALLVPVVAAFNMQELSKSVVGSTAFMMLKGFVQSTEPRATILVSIPYQSYFPTGAVVAYLAFGGMMNLKSVVMLPRVLTLKATAYLLVLSTLLVSVLSFLINLAIP